MPYLPMGANVRTLLPKREGRRLAGVGRDGTVKIHDATPLPEKP
jgi:hypothetical protein